MENNISEEEKIKRARSAFAKFKSKMSDIFRRQSELFDSVMNKINNRKIDEQKKRLEDVYKNK